MRYGVPAEPTGRSGRQAASPDEPPGADWDPSRHAEDQQSGSRSLRARSGSGSGLAGPDGQTPPQDPEAAAREICLRMLAAAPRTRAQLTTGLRRRGIPDEVIAGVLDRYEDVGMIDDRMFAAAWVESRHAGRGLGRRALAYELRQRGVDEATVAEAVSGLTPDQEYTTARRLAARKLATMSRLDHRTRVRRLAGMLVRKGYGAGLTARVVRDVLAAAGDADAADPVDLDAVLDHLGEPEE
ncbi:Regulatory protein RecX [Carbonactinospora thermoautotrophica]|uniref:Regulatory protein RecX n=2 Tax=Carbonactinospora thermoautotrophica TaxID=1469144 RepID=A0A132MQR3_9ACTN|nr:regulatory protein RecX [Carbonactinospora thermoautotrophica]KWW99751.1 Regulatory protein RecX [Carbonactinospora thermoautotrophica]